MSPDGAAGGERPARSPAAHLLVRTASNPWLILALLVAASIVSFIDRQIISVLIDPIRSDLKITDFQIGLLTGPAFVTLYVFGNLASGWLVDRFNRVAVIATALGGWSLASAACGLTASFPALFAARAAVGLGEGSVGPGYQTILADAFPARRLPFALSVYAMSGAIGPGLAVLLGGVVAAHIGGVFRGWPVLGGLHAWQLTFIVVSLPGLLLAPVLWRFVRPGPRRVSEAAAQAATESLRSFWRARRRLIVLFIVGIGFLTAAELALTLWLPTLLMRRHGLSAAQVAAELGPLLIVLGAAGSLLWGGAASWNARRQGAASAMGMMTLAMAVMTPFLAFAPMAPTPALLLAGIAPALLCRRAYVGLGHAAVQLATPPALRGRVAGVYLATASCIGAFLGPPAIGALTTYVFHSDRSLDLALSTVGGGAAALGVLCLMAAQRPYREALALLPSEAPA
jgi:MFS family permease